MSRFLEGDKHAKIYSQYRPNYPSELYDSLVEYMHDSGASFGVAVDVACGSGQAIRPLTKLFKKVIGSDISESQIEIAKAEYPEVEFHVGPAEDMSFLETGSVDLISCAMSLHRLDAERFYAEAHRVLKHGGVIACWCYGPVVMDKVEAQQIFLNDFFKAIVPYRDPQSAHVTDHYTNLHIPFKKSWEHFARLDHFQIHMVNPLSQFVGYLGSLSGTVKYLKDHPGSNFLDEIYDKLKEVCKDRTGQDNEDPEISYTWPLFMLLGTNN